MANLTAVLRKTIDGLPNATPQLRAKVYEKARAAITRQIQAANPPLDDPIVEARYRVLEDAIRETEAHYNAVEGTTSDLGGETRTADRPDVGKEIAPTSDREPDVERFQTPPSARSPGLAPPVFGRVTPTTATRPVPPPAARDGRDWDRDPGAPEERPEAPASNRSDDGAAPSVPVVMPSADRPERTMSRPAFPMRQSPAEPAAAAPEPKVGEVGPLVEPSPDEARPAASVNNGLRPAAPANADETSRTPARSRPDAIFAGIPEADLKGPRYPAPRAPKRRPGALAAGVAVLALAGLGTAGWIYQDDIRSLLSGSSQVASVPPAATTPTTDTGEPVAPADPTEPPSVAVPPVGAPVDTATPAPVEPGGVQPRQFTQRLLPDGSEVDAGPGASVANAFEEGTNVATASVNTPPPADPAPTPPTAAPQAAPAVAGVPDAGGTVPIGQRAIFYEERSASREGSQQTGNVVWSVVSEPPADGQPPEPAIRAVADVPNEDLKMTLTIRRNADTTLPASHVIEIMFDVPSSFPGGQIENVQRLALKPTEQARGEPLIGVAGKISDGFFIIALNDLKQAVDSNLGLLGSEEWIDVPLAYSSGQRALMSIEKGIPGERVFKEAMDAWAAKT